MADCCVGLRVVRGPDWEWGDQDGGEGCVGTVVFVDSTSHSSESVPDVAVVQWDVGERYTYRCGAQGKYDLRVLDSGAAGIRHAHIKCNACGVESITGSIWRCIHCLQYHLCTPCYMLDRHSVWHRFNRIDSPSDFYKRTRVTCRKLSRWVAARGVFSGATVVRGNDWKWSNQDGGPGNVGKVLDITGWHSESSRSVAEVEWSGSARRRKYRMGHKGKVDLHCSVPAEFGHCYLDHLPVLGAPYEPPKNTFIAAGDRVVFTMDIEKLQAQQLAGGVVDDLLVEYLGKIGLVSQVDLDEKMALLTFMRNIRLAAPTDGLEKVEAPVHIPDDVVRVLDDIAEVHRLQQGHHGWEDDMALSLGQTGRVIHVLDDGDVRVWTNGRRWTFNPACLQHALGEDVEDCPAEEVSVPFHLDLLMVSILKEFNPDMLFRACARGDASVVRDLIEKWPSEVNTRHAGRTALHVAADEGRPNVIQVLLEHKADIKARDKLGENPLHCCAHFNHCQSAKVLLEAGCDVNAKSDIGLTPVHIAAALGFSRLLKVLLDNPNSKINAQNVVGDTPLHLACSSFWIPNTQLLVETGSNITLFDQKGVGALALSILKEFFPGLEILISAHPEAINQTKVDDGFTLLHIAVLYDLCDEISYLAAMDTCEVNGKDYSDQTPLHIAAKNGFPRSIECLVGYGADVTLIDVQGHAPLHLVLGKKNMKPLSEWTVHLNKVYKEVRAAADNSIQSVPSYITVACFMAQEGASLHTASVEGLTPLDLCPSEFRPLLKQFSTPERRQHYTGSLPRHPPPTATPCLPRPPQPTTPQQKSDAKANSIEALATPTSTSANKEGTVATPTSTIAKLSTMATPTPTGANKESTVATPTTGANQESSVTSISEKILDKGTRKDSSSSGPPTPPLQHQMTTPKNTAVQASCYLCEEPSDICFKPCGHIAMCDVCAKRVIRCPTCRNDVLEKIKIPTQ